jgi:hypothetical protein
MYSSTNGLRTGGGTEPFSSVGRVRPEYQSSLYAIPAHCRMHIYISSSGTQPGDAVSLRVTRSWVYPIELLRDRQKA